MKKWFLAVIILLPVFILINLFSPVNHALALIGRMPLKGTVIAIDPGHGGKDPGARTPSIDEDIINLDISLKLRTLLEAAGASVIMTRDADYDLAPSDVNNVKRADMKERAAVLNQENITLFISIHGNISLDRTCHGAEVYYRINDENSRQLAESILNQLRPITDSRFLTKKGDFYLLNNTNTLGVLVETGFLSNAEDLKKLKTEKYQEEIAFGIFEGILDFLKILQ